MGIDIQKSIIIDVSALTQQEVFNLISKEAVSNGYADNATLLLKALNEREAEGTTGMMDGFAIPHAKSKTIKKPAMVIFKLTEGVEWNSMDGKKIEFVISLMIPEKEKGTTHLQLLSKVARLLMKNDVKQLLKNANSASEIDSIFTRYITK
ncbi:PTS sugar transporter subunit IIA [Marinilactibacillus psychrotolerans]|uniref:PTS fructose transporter subunit IIA n=2 Tax=Marinilactibacillus psychrotolerans TaxID=191770 RepID=A0A5R9BVM2_9LACT|nr:fructose PTS transporter subunit IIA [Marinilactibacillus psychrotolerans]TLQ04699.1 PTS fructose transporter subunit IIA [Marinilactibacillus psychrotolerans]GEQ32990.1 fructose/mannitol-specific PTS system IIA component [Marinilactibacillus psychrotolerans]SJN33067.1 PTS system, galactose-inducible IIA component [Marinilactibacillus psychrotolerans 42ea]